MAQDGINPDNESYDSLRKRSEQGDVNAQCKLGLMHHKGEGAPLHPGEAKKWLTAAAEQGEPHAQFALGEACLRNNDLIYAYAWFTLAYAAGIRDAKPQLDYLTYGGMDEEGAMSSEDIKKAQDIALELWKKYNKSDEE